MFERRDEQRREDLHCEDEQRREDRCRENYPRQIDEQRREDQHREERCEDRADAEREARLDARLANAHQLAPLTPRTGTSDQLFKSNKAFDVVPLFSCANSQPLIPWTNEFLAQAEIVGEAHNNLHELRLKLRYPARAYFNRLYPTTYPGAPPVLEAMDYLCS